MHRNQPDPAPSSSRFRDDPEWQAAQAAYLAASGTAEATFAAHLISASRMYRIERRHRGRSVDGLTGVEEIEAEVRSIFALNGDGPAAWLPLNALAERLKAEAWVASPRDAFLLRPAEDAAS